MKLKAGSLRRERREITIYIIEKQKYKKILWTVTCQQIEHPIRNGWISGNIQSSETESGKNRQSE